MQPSRLSDAISYLEEATRWIPAPAGASEMHDAAFDRSPTGASSRTMPRAEGMGYRREGNDEPAPPRVLIADDNADMRTYLRSLLSGTYTVQAEGDGAAALAAARDRPPDLILADVMMPEFDGFALLRALRADPATREIPVMLLSARAGEEATVEALTPVPTTTWSSPSPQASCAPAWRRIGLPAWNTSAATERALRAERRSERAPPPRHLPQAPVMTAVLRGSDHVFEIANTLYQQGTGRAAGER